MSYPALPKGYRWDVEFSTQFNIPSFKARILKKGWIFSHTMAKGEPYLNQYISSEASLNRAVEEAYRRFQANMQAWEFNAKAEAKAKELNR